jgi:hypothetical protein
MLNLEYKVKKMELSCKVSIIWNTKKNAFIFDIFNSIFDNIQIKIIE